ncbi:MAG: MFS transporter [Cyanobacteriota bacterium]|nr:MFS transporter [Cyanobacteriota bacterium]
MNSKDKTHLSFFQLLNMSAGFFGIQFGWGLQLANTSAIFEHLGAEANEIPILWLAAPLTGLLVQPIIGYASDRTWCKLGRRRPYFLVGAIISSIALIAMPHSSSLWMATGCLWLLDASNNLSMQPFRALVGDLLPPEQRTQGFALQGLFTGAGAVLASMFPWLLGHVLRVSDATVRPIPLRVEMAFYIGAAIFLSTIIWTVFTTKEYPPKPTKAITPEVSVANGWRAIARDIVEMPATMKQLAWVQFFSWLGMFCVFLYFPPAVARHIFGATDRNSLLYAEGIEWAGLCMALYNAVCMVFSFLLPQIANLTSRKLTHGLCLLCGAAGLISLWFVHDRYTLFISMTGVGVAWASMHAMPFAILIDSLPSNRLGSYMGIFNAFIVLPQVTISLGFGWVMSHFLGNDRLLAVVLGGVAMFVAALLVPMVEDKEEAATGVDISEAAGTIGG